MKGDTRTGAQKRNPPHLTIQLFLDHVPQQIPVNEEGLSLVNCRISLGFPLAISAFQIPVPFDG
jgi:hypothetical protein